MNSGNPHLLKLTIADLNALTVHAEQSLFCGSILEHINTLDRNHRDTVVSIEMTTKRFTHEATTPKNSAKW